jgi:hypothetical protein
MLTDDAIFGLSPKHLTMTMRRRRLHPTEDDDVTPLLESVEMTPTQSLEKDPKVVQSSAAKHANEMNCFTISKWLIMRLTGMIYFVAFLGALHQNEGLMGSYGLLPAEKYMGGLKEQESSPWAGFSKSPTLFWFFDLNDSNMQGVIWVGLFLSAVVVAGVNSWVVQLALWLLDFSIVTVSAATPFYNYGWESQILETGFLSIFLCALPYITKEKGKWSIRLALWELASLEAVALAPSPVILWLFRWLSFRISVGAGLIKTRGSSCWAEKTCLHYHFETQPLPSPLSYIYHFLPSLIQRRMVDVDLWVQLYTSWFVLLPTSIPLIHSPWLSFTLRTILRVGGFVQAGFMVGILLSGNFSFLNHLTIIPALACIDNACWPKFLHRLVLDRESDERGSVGNSGNSRSTLLPRRLIDLALFLWIGFLSRPVVANLFQRNGGQLMNASFDPFRLVNTYGAFGSVGVARYEPIISVSDDGQLWRELELPCKPGDVTRRPCFCAPYHYRADWNIWFIGFPPHKNMLQGREQWVYGLLFKILEHEAVKRPWLALLDSKTATFLSGTYYDKDEAPRYAKVDMYHYEMAAPLSTILWRWAAGRGQIWWTRQFKEFLLPPITLDKTKGRLVLADLSSLS